MNDVWKYYWTRWPGPYGQLTARRTTYRPEEVPVLVDDDLLALPDDELAAKVRRRAKVARRPLAIKQREAVDD